MMRSAPHQIRMAKREFKHVLTEVRKLWGQVSIAPSFDLDQSWVRINAPSSLGPLRKSRELVGLITVLAATSGLTFSLSRKTITTGQLERRNSDGSVPGDKWKLL